MILRNGTRIKLRTSNSFSLLAERRNHFGTAKLTKYEYQINPNTESKYSSDSDRE